MKLKELMDVVKTELSELSTLNNPDFRLEQAEFQKKDNNWEIVISYLVDNTNPKNAAMAAITSGFQYHRIYKKVKIDENKNVIGFYIYEKE
ncbi:hypothetical protein [Fulvivirga sp.]|uniref:hypothetical protein n=1 Tax=Fulvivirga sp. TaxID=1931237 RepID=UPI0032EBBB0F